MRKCIILWLILLFLVITNIISGNNTAKMTYIDSIKAKPITESDYEMLYPDEYSFTETEIIYKSDIEGLGAYLKYEDGWEITIKWNDLSKVLKMGEDFMYIKWRPNQSSFIYAIFSDVGGDFGKCSMYYVTVDKSNGVLKISNELIASDYANTDLAWSTNGKYIVYSEYSSLRIMEFETGKVWAIKLIVVETETETMEIKERLPIELGGFYWNQNNGSLRCFWKRHPNDDAPSGYLEFDQNTIYFIDDQFRYPVLPK